VSSLWRRSVGPIVALGCCSALWAIAAVHPAGKDLAAVAARFEFAGSPLPTAGAPTHKSVRTVNPSLAHISAWISSVGAAVALGDLDGDGLPNDFCSVDPRSDQVTIAPVPGTPPRYAPFSLDGPDDHDPTIAPMGCVPADLNEDGHPDLLVYYWGRPPLAFLRIPGTPLEKSGFRRVDIADPAERWYSMAATFADLDGDGHLDLVVGNYFADGARILDGHAQEPDSMQDSMSLAYNGGRKRILRWVGAERGSRPSVRYQAVEALDEEVARGWTLAVGAADLDGDGLPELYFANDFGPDRLLHNRSQPGHIAFGLVNGRRDLTTPKSKVLGRDSFKGMGVDFGDVDGDGRLDIAVSNITAEYALEESNFLFLHEGKDADFARGVAPFVDRAERYGVSRSGWAWAVRLADFDNDGKLEMVQATGFIHGSVDRWPELQELAMGNDALVRDPRSWPRFVAGDDLSGRSHLVFFARGADDVYRDVSGLVGLGRQQIGRGIAVADVDGDGLLDLAVANQWEESYFYRNTSTSGAGFIGLRLLLPIDPGESSRPTVLDGRPGLLGRARPAIGAAATVHLPGGGVLVSQVDGGNGHASARSPELHFGLGLSVAPSYAVDIAWRDGGGRRLSATVSLEPGWHTVVLGWPRVEGRR